ncbi:Uncharacterized protein APZ42_010220 [Daphnia magna]|uniref:CCHC-type domain-containing protein n=1 Tax=Daphnia magna TaxID=35525 RepID=A0A164DHX9_9CRUS|nr:Uncharacterized protein APZ42_010220 [Daphnia magna]
MRDTTRIKILIQGILPKIKTELYLRMPEEANEFDALCKQLFISEQILQNKENNDDKKLTAVIAGIAHRGKQQDFEIEKLRQKILEMECANKNEISQGKNAVIAATDQYEPRRSKSGEHNSRPQYPRVRFNNNQQNSRESSYSRSREPNFPRSREASPYRENYKAQRGRESFQESTTQRQTPYLYGPHQNGQRQLNQRHFQRPQNNSYQPQRNIYQPNRFQNFGNPQNQPWRESTGDQYQPRGQPFHNTQPAKNSDITCYKCNKKGHIARECWTDMARINRQRRRQM